MNSKATHTGRPKSRSCNGSYTGRGVGGRNRCAPCRATVSQARAKCKPAWTVANMTMRDRPTGSPVKVGRQ